jgi:transposase InsO family protein
MSRKGNCIDNAPIESFFGHFKDDVEYRSCKTFEELKTMVDEYMRYYNNERHQWDIQKMTPVEYRNHLLLSV